jgi:hypothetical protein
VRASQQTQLSLSVCLSLLSIGALRGLYTLRWHVLRLVETSTTRSESAAAAVLWLGSRAAVVSGARAFWAASSRSQVTSSVRRTTIIIIIGAIQGACLLAITCTYNIFQSRPSISCVDKHTLMFNLQRRKELGCSACKMKEQLRSRHDNKTTVLLVDVGAL